MYASLSGSSAHHDQVAQPRWYVVQTHPHAEQKASTPIFLARDMAYILPRYLSGGAMRAGSKRSRRRFSRAICLSPSTGRCSSGGAFIRRSASAGWSASATSPRRFQSVWLKGCSSDRTKPDFVHLSLPPRFAAGDRVRVLDGVFTACLGLYEKMTESERVAVLLDLLGRKVRVVLDADSICAA